MLKPAAVEISLSKNFPFGKVQSDVKRKRKTPSELREEQDGKKIKQVIPHEIIDVDEDEDPKVVFVGGSTSNCMNKQPMKFGKCFDMQLKQPDPKKSTRIQPKVMGGKPIGLKVKAFKQFDIVRGEYDHTYQEPLGDYDHTYQEPLDASDCPGVKMPLKDWTKRIHREWKVLKENLPETIYVRVYADRMDILRACIIGAAGTPYHDGLFFFDAYFPPSYPSSPPLVTFRSHGLQLNPNLHGNEVCLSLLGTWGGRGCEVWSPPNSTMLQVLVSIQALVLNAKPYFNDPMVSKGSKNRPPSEKPSLLYNERVFLASCRMMLYSLRRPPMHFGDFIGWHFDELGHAILDACRAYLDGAQIGCLVGGVQDVDEGDKSCSEEFRNSLKTLYNELLMEFQKVRDGGIGATRRYKQLNCV